MTTDLTILGLDISSTHIGLVLLAGDKRLDRQTWRHSGGDIAMRCLLARDCVAAYLDQQADVDLVAIEAPVAKYANALIPQARVSGAVLAVVAARGLLWVGIAPAQAKQALIGKGSASKQEMCAAAGLSCEHQSDALGLALAAARLGVTKEVA